MRRVYTGLAPEVPEGETRDITSGTEMGISQVSRIPASLEGDLEPERPCCSCVCLGLHVPERQEQLVQVLREEHGTSRFPEMEKQILPLPWSLLLPMPLQGCSRDSTVSHVRIPRGLGVIPSHSETRL